MPQFLVGKAPFFDANWYNEEREFGLPRMTLRGQEDLAAHLLRDGRRARSCPAWATTCTRTATPAPRA
jgi:hypothetical protein